MMPIEYRKLKRMPTKEEQSEANRGLNFKISIMIAVAVPRGDYNLT